MIRGFCLFRMQSSQLRSRSLWDVWCMMRDPSLDIRVWAARTVEYSYGKWYLVPWRLRMLARHWETYR